MRTTQSTISKLFPKRTINKNKSAIKAFNLYKKMADILDRAYFASGKKPSFQINTGSALKAQVNFHGISSTQKI